MPGDDPPAGPRNEITGAAADAIVQAGSIHGDVHLHPRGPLVRSAYLEQVARIAPVELRDRDAELARLAEWAVRGDEPYRWLRAPAWAGKSALMSWFALHPPDGVRVVSFFVTARLSGQGDKTAFAEVVIEQLAELLREPLPQLLTDATRDAHLLGLLNRAAAACRDRGERLVLVVDGLDEDVGVTGGPDGHSIAALLPAAPAPGLRVVVSGRPDPPIPVDVPAHHPLRDPRVVRELSRSAHAEVVRADAQRELVRLVRGNDTARDLLGLLAAAGGGLTAADLVELTGRPAWEVEEQLHAVSGRAFSRRAGHWGVSAGHVYLMAHEQLQRDALRMLGEERLAGFRQRLHDWAERHRAAGWPGGTPEYLLLGYFRLLRETGEVDRLIRCALDRARHARMSDLTGGDSAALTEVATAREVLCSQAEPDPLAAIRLGIYRGELANRNLLVPAELPVAWVRLGHWARAEALAWVLPDAAQRTRVLLAVSRAVAATGDLARAEAIAASAYPSGPRTSLARRRLSRSGDHPAVLDAPTEVRGARRSRGDNRKTRFDKVVAAIAQGDLALSERLARRLRRGSHQAKALIALVRALSREGRLAQAEAIARGITHPRLRAEALTALVLPVADAGDPRRAELLASEAERTARLADVRPRPEVVVTVLGAAAAAGDVGTAEALARSLDDPRLRARALTGLVAVVADTGDTGRAEALASTIDDPHWRARALFRAGGDVERCLDLVRPLFDAVRHGHERAEVLAAWSVALADRGDPDRAERAARSARNAAPRGRALAHLARVLAERGDPDRADALAAGIDDPDHRARALAAVARAAADPARARRVPDPRWRVHALAGLVTTDELVAAVGEVDRTQQRAQAWCDVVTAAARRGELDRAERLAGAIALPVWRARALTDLVPLVAEVAGAERARAVADRVEDPDARARALAALVPHVPGAEADRLVVAVVALHRWELALPALARCKPEITSAIARDFLAATRV